jgi:hypothetical protein
VEELALIELDPELQAIASAAPEQAAIDFAHQDMQNSSAIAKVEILIKTIRHPQLPVTSRNALQLAEFERPVLFSMYEVCGRNISYQEGTKQFIRRNPLIRCWMVTVVANNWEKTTWC